MVSSSNEKILKFQKLVKLYEKKLGDIGKKKKQLKEIIKVKDLRIQDLEKENEELQSKLNAKSIFSNMEVNYGQLIAVQKENSELKTNLTILEVKSMFLKNFIKFDQKKEFQIYKEKQENNGHLGDFNKKKVSFSNGVDSSVLEQMSLMILNNRAGNRKMQEEWKKNMKESYGEKFVETMEKYFNKLSNVEIRNKKYAQALLSNVDFIFKIF